MHIDCSYHFSMVKVLRVAVALEDPVAAIFRPSSLSLILFLASQDANENSVDHDNSPPKSTT